MKPQNNELTTRPSLRGHQWFVCGVGNGDQGVSTLAPQKCPVFKNLKPHNVVRLNKASFRGPGDAPHAAFRLYFLPTHPNKASSVNVCLWKRLKRRPKFLLIFFIAVSPNRPCKTAMEKPPRSFVFCRHSSRCTRHISSCSWSIKAGIWISNFYCPFLAR